MQQYKILSEIIEVAYKSEKGKISFCNFGKKKKKRNKFKNKSSIGEQPARFILYKNFVM